MVLMDLFVMTRGDGRGYGIIWVALNLARLLCICIAKITTWDTGLILGVGRMGSTIQDAKNEIQLYRIYLSLVLYCWTTLQPAHQEQLDVTIRAKLFASPVTRLTTPSIS
jgi:hypothetical protein